MNLNRDCVIELFSRHVSKGKADFYKKYDVMLVPGKRNGCYIHDINGKDYINCHSNGGVFNLGHRNPRIIESVKKAMDLYDIGNHHLVSSPRAELAKMIAGTMPGSLNQVVYGVGGGEAVDLAIKLARGVTGRREIISARGGYHGHTGLALAAGDPRFKKIFKPLPAGFRQVKFNDAGELRKIISESTAAVILETIPATSGIITPEKNYLSDVKELCTKKGALLILDEIQTGFGRTGRFWGFDNYNAAPDMVTIGKGMSGGIYPISATIYDEKYAGFFREDPFIHISTFGGSEIGCFAAMETIKISSGKNFLLNVNKMGDFFKEKFIALASEYPLLGLKIRGKGLMMGLEFKDEITSLFMVKLFFDNGLYTVYSGNEPRVIQFLPPLIINMTVAREALKRAEKSFKAIK